MIDGKRPVPLPDKQSYETLPTGGAGGKAKSKGKGKAKAKGSGSSWSAGSSSATKSSSSGGYSSSSTLTAIKAARASLAGQGGLGNDLGASLGMPMGGPKVNSFALVLDGWTLKLVLGSADPEAAAAEDTAKDTRAELRDLFLEVASRVGFRVWCVCVFKGGGGEVFLFLFSFCSCLKKLSCPGYQNCVGFFYGQRAAVQVLPWPIKL